MGQGRFCEKRKGFEENVKGRGKKYQGKIGREEKNKMKQKACRICKRIFDGDKCPSCGSKESADSFKGKTIILNPEKSEIAKKLNIKEKGSYAIKT